MSYTETKIATYTNGKTRIQLLKLTSETDQVTIVEISNTVGGFIAKYNDGCTRKIQDSSIEWMARSWGLKKDNENYYYKPAEEINKIIETKYQIRINRKRVYTTGFEYDARKYFAQVVQNDILQLKIY